MTSLKKTVAGGLAALTLATSVVAFPASAEAGPRYGYYAPYNAPVVYRQRRRNVGGAVAAGVIGGLALGALAATATRPAYGYAAPAYGYAEPSYDYGPECFVERRRRVNRFGEVVVRDVQVCR